MQKVFGGIDLCHTNQARGPLITTTDLDGAYRGESRQPPSHDVETLAAAYRSLTCQRVAELSIYIPGFEFVPGFDSYLRILFFFTFWIPSSVVLIFLGT